MGLEEAMSWQSCSISWHSFSPWHNLSKLSSAHDLPKELFIVVKVVLVVFLYVHDCRQTNVQGEALFIVVKVVLVVFPHVHVVSVRQVFEAEQALRGSFTGRRGSER